VYLGKKHPTDAGVAQGTVISPLLSNIYLHALDVYITSEIIPNIAIISGAEATSTVTKGGKLYTSTRRKATYQVEK